MIPLKEDQFPEYFIQVIREYGFIKYNRNIWTLDIKGTTRCWCRIFVHLLSDEKTTRVSIGDYNCALLDNPIDVFETKDREKIDTLLKTVDAEREFTCICPDDFCLMGHEHCKSVPHDKK